LVAETRTEADVRRPKLRIARYAAVVMLLVAGCAISFFYYIGVIGENFRVISPARCYRSAQLSLPALQKHIDDDHIGCVVNLRGFCKDDWYEKEVALCKRSNVAHADFKIDPVRLPRPEVLHDLVAQLKAGPYPILMHCRNGVDRTGLAATLYEIVVDRKPVDEALASELTWRYGHFRSSKNDAAERFFALYRDSQNGQSVEAWIEQSYPEKYKSLGPYGGGATTAPVDENTSN
jgi:hypothetical protein